MNNLEKNWEKLVTRLEDEFNQEITLKGLLYLIGIQELNFGVKKFDRHEKINVIHVAVCKILTPFGFYKFHKIDEDGWPHYIELKAIKNLTEKEQENLMKKAVLKYLN